jgi:hypothetical protein
MMHQDRQWNWEGLDNKFHIAGGGVHGEANGHTHTFKPKKKTISTN